jgi:hypothetical protein
MGGPHMAFRKYVETVPALFYLWTAAFCSSALAQSTDSLNIIVSDFSTINGCVVASKNNEFIVDLDESKGSHAGDLLAVVGMGDPIVHPISGKTIGNIDTIKAVLKITRLNVGFSFARLIKEISPIAAGDAVRRYGGLRADFWDLTGKGRPLWQLLQRQLPDIVWGKFEAVYRQSNLRLQDLMPASPASLHFILTPDFLKVIDSEANPLHEYALTIVRNTITGFPAFNYHLSKPSKDDNLSSSQPTSVGSTPPPQHPLDPAIDLSAAVPVGEIRGNVVMADFVGNAGGVLMASTDGATIEVYEVSAGIRAVAKADIGVQEQILFLKWWCPPDVPSIYLSASIWSDHRPSAVIFELKGNQLEMVFQRPGCMVGAFDLDGDQIPETLLSQQFDPEEFFGYRFHQLVCNGTAVEVIRSDLKLPLAFTISGSQFADLTNDGKNESIVVRNGVLNIYAEREPLYASAKQMGGSVSVLTYKKDPSFKAFGLGSVSFEIPPLAVDIDNDLQRELLAISSDRSTFSTPGAYINIKNIRFVCFKYTDGSFVKKSLSPPLDTPVQGLAMIGNHIYYIVTELTSGSHQSCRGRIFKFQIKESHPKSPHKG